MSSFSYLHFAFATKHLSHAFVFVNTTRLGLSSPGTPETLRFFFAPLLVDLEEDEELDSLLVDLEEDEELDALLVCSTFTVLGSPLSDGLEEDDGFGILLLCFFFREAATFCFLGSPLLDGFEDDVDEELRCCFLFGCILSRLRLWASTHAGEKSPKQY